MELMHDLHAALLALQQMDDDLIRTGARLQEFTPQLEALEAPIGQLEKEIETTRARLEEMLNELGRLERGAEQKRERLFVYQERANRPRGHRDEAAIRAEIDLVRRAIEADVDDAKSLQEQATRTDLKLDDLALRLEKQRLELQPQREALLAARRELEEELEMLQDRRSNQAVRIDKTSLRLYERVRSGKSRLVVAPLTDEGACGNCFNVLPIQQQSEVRRAATLHRCEGCGVILYLA